MSQSPPVEVAGACTDGAESIAPMSEALLAEPSLLRGRRLLLAAADQSARWYLGDVIRKAGGTLIEVADGAAARAAAFREAPDLVMASIGLPCIDGPALCSELRADAVLADVPFVLLGRNQGEQRDVQRVYPLVSACLTTDVSAETLLRVLGSQLAACEDFERRLSGNGAPLSGSLDGFSPYRWLRAICALHPNAVASLKSAAFEYTLHVRQGAPRAVLRVDPRGLTERRDAALTSLMQERAGSFTVERAESRVNDPMVGTLAAQLSLFLARTRALAPASGPLPLPAATTTTAVAHGSAAMCLIRIDPEAPAASRPATADQDATEPMLPRRAPSPPASTRSTPTLPLPLALHSRPAPASRLHSLEATRSLRWRSAAATTLRSTAMVLVAAFGVLVGAWLHAR